MTRTNKKDNREISLTTKLQYTGTWEEDILEDAKSYIMILLKVRRREKKPNEDRVSK